MDDSYGIMMTGDNSTDRTMEILSSFPKEAQVSISKDKDIIDFSVWHQKDNAPKVCSQQAMPLTRSLVP
jgi:hypothetical protein